MAKKADKAPAVKSTPAAPRQAAVIPQLRPGDIVDVQVRIIEGDKERLQSFQGTIIGIRGAGRDRSFTVRKVSRGFGIERIFPVSTPAIAGVEVKRHSKVRRAKLYYMRKLVGREAMLKERKGAGKPRQEPVAK